MIETREQAWVAYTAAMHEQLNEARKDWNDEVQERGAEAARYLEENPSTEHGIEPVQIVLSPTSMGQIGELIDGIVEPVQDALKKMSGAVELLHRIADSQDLWVSILDFDTVLQKDGIEVTLSKAERGYLRSLLGDILTYAGREDYLTEQLGPGPVIPPMPQPPAHRPPEGYALSEVQDGPVYHAVQPQVVAQQDGVTVAVAPQPQVQQVVQQPVEGMSPVAKARARRNAMYQDMPEEQDQVSPVQQAAQAQQPPGVEVWEGAPMHNCREWLDADDVCQQCGAVVQPIRPRVVDGPVV